MAGKIESSPPSLSLFPIFPHPDQNKATAAAVGAAAAAVAARAWKEY